MTEKKEPHFKVIDKRRIGKEDAPEVKKESKVEEDKSSGGDEESTIDRSDLTEDEKDVGKDKDFHRGPGEQGHTGETQFSGLVISLHTSVLYSLGLIGEEGAPKRDPDLKSAREYIDLLGMLEEKTKGNLSEEEEKLIKESLYQLRMAFINISNPKANNP